MAKRRITGWTLSYDDWAPAEQPLREALTTLGNGYFATRGAFEEVRAGGPHYPGTYLAGGYNRLASRVAGRVVENEDLVNWPNWLPLTFRVEGGEWFELRNVDVIAHEQTLDLRRGVLSRRVKFRDRGGHTFEIASRRIVHMGEPHLAAIEWTLTPFDWSGRIEIRTALDGRVTNSGVARYRDLRGVHIEVLETGPAGEDAICLLARSFQSRIVMAQAARTHVFRGGRPVMVERRLEAEPRRASQHLVVRCEAGVPLRVEKIVAVYTSRDFAISEPRLEACQAVRRAPDFAGLLRSHEEAWRFLWHRADLQLSGPGDHAQMVLRLHAFHMLQTTSMHAIDADVGVPARGLHGEAYRGHVLWDEIFIFPFLSLRIPELTRALLMYRYRRLGEARFAAREAGLAGAMFPWQSGSNGREESQVLHLNPRSGRWVADETFRQRHVGAAIAYNVWQYFQATNDREFMSFYGAEMLVEIARFWASIAVYNPHRKRYEIRGVVGPDEFHTHYVGRDAAGLDNNAYTNVMAAWSLRTALSALDLLAVDRREELLANLDVPGEELDRWDEISRNMFVPFQDGGIISQFEGWAELEEVDWDGLRERHGDIQRLDRILEAEGDDINRYKATKQADVLMLFYLFSAEELAELFERLRYPFDPQSIPRTIDYYLARTSDGSTLSRIVHAWVLARTDRHRSWHLFKNALASDIEDIQGGTSSEGIHLGAMAGSVDLVQRCYTGLEMRNEVLWLNPQLPKDLRQLKLWVHYRGHWLAICVTHERMTVSFERGWPSSACVGFRGEVYEMVQGSERTFEM